MKVGAIISFGFYFSKGGIKTNINAKPVIPEQIGQRIVYNCPKCRKPLIFRKKYMGKSLCIQCGQRLDWESSDSLSFEIVEAGDSDEAAWIANTYYECVKAPESERLDTDDWRKSLRNKKTELYLIFFDKKQHGQFMRKYAKEVKK